MATTVITKSSLTLVGGGVGNHSSGTSGTLFSTSASQYATMTIFQNTGTTGQSSVSLGAGNVFTAPIISEGGACTIYVPPSTTVTYSAPPGGVVLVASWVLYANS